MTPAEKATVFVNDGLKHINGHVSYRNRSSISLPVIHHISNCDYKIAISKITDAINDLNKAKAALAPLAENRPRD